MDGMIEIKNLTKIYKLSKKAQKEPLRSRIPRKSLWITRPLKRKKVKFLDCLAPTVQVRRPRCGALLHF